jgi:hypothetical protein
MIFCILGVLSTNFRDAFNPSTTLFFQRSSNVHPSCVSTEYADMNVRMTVVLKPLHAGVSP